MSERLPTEELVRTRKSTRSERISKIRRRVAVTAALLPAVFGGLILVRSELNQPAEAAPVAASQDQNLGELVFDKGSIAEAAVSAASNYAVDAVFGGGSSDDESGSVTPLSSSQS